MSNPEKLELPEDYDDPRLTEYTWSYDVLFYLAFASKKDIVPGVEMQIYGTRASTKAFHLMAVPELEYLKEAEQVFEIDQLNPRGESFSDTRAEIFNILGYQSNSKGKPSIEDWHEQSIKADFGFFSLQKLRVRFLWQIRGWSGLTLDFVRSEIFGNGANFEFERVWDEDVPEEEAQLLQDEVLSARTAEKDSLRLSDTQQAASHALASCLASPTTTPAEDLTQLLFEFGYKQIYREVAGLELAKFHFPELDICVSCGQESNSSKEHICWARSNVWLHF